MIKSRTKEFLRASMRIKIIIALLTILLIVLMFPKGESLESDVTVGSVWIQDDLIASTTFEILKDRETFRREQREAAESIHKIFIRDEDVPARSIDSLDAYNKMLLGLLDKEIYRDGDISGDNVFLTPDSYQSFVELRKMENALSANINVTFKQIFGAIEGGIREIYNTGMLSIDSEEIAKDSISLREGKFERLVSKDRFFDRSEAFDGLADYIDRRLNMDENLRNSVIEYATEFLKPNIIYSENLTREAKRAAMEKVSRNKGIVNENERIVAKHNRITPEIKEKIESYRMAIGEEKGMWGRFMQNLGKFIHIIIVISLFILYLYLFRKEIYRDNQKLLLISIVVLLLSFIAFLIRQINVNSPIELLVLVPVASMLLTVIFDSRLGFYGTIVVALITGGLQGNDYVFTVTHLFAGALAAFTVRDIKNRTQIFRSFLFILLAYISAIVAFGFESFASIDQMLIEAAFAGSNALISPVLAYGLIIFFERAFKITTDLTLLELTDFNHPLLKELARKAPGTFTHSMTIGSLVESAAEAIGANPLLARVGAYYHDIGKMSEPDNFVENQGDENVHEKMDPSKSARVIIEHVKRGMELAKKYNLPKEVIDFIPMHHGTMVVFYFYNKAKEEFGAENVSIENYRYPGPKPRTKETTLLMLADACESTVRSMDEPEPQKIENVINNLIKIRVDDGQLNESPITLGDLKKVRESFLSILISQHHKRIKYPKQDEMESDSDKEGDDGKVS